MSDFVIPSDSSSRHRPLRPEDTVIDLESLAPVTVLNTKSTNNSIISDRESNKIHDSSFPTEENIHALGLSESPGVGRTFARKDSSVRSWTDSEPLEETTRPRLFPASTFLGARAPTYPDWGNPRQRRQRPVEGCGDGSGTVRSAFASMVEYETKMRRDLESSHP
ncbi:hypothetical protein BGW38_007626, partial [Lunasporangiospora selenospora]